MIRERLRERVPSKRLSIARISEHLPETLRNSCERTWTSCSHMNEVLYSDRGKGDLQKDEGLRFYLLHSNSSSTQHKVAEATRVH